MIAISLAHQLGLVPLVWLVILQARGRKVDVGLWWMAGALGVSWIADSAADFVNPWIPSNTYPIAQCGLLVRTITDRTTTTRFLVILGIAAVVSFFVQRNQNSPEIIVGTVAFAGVVWFAWPLWQLGALRTSFLVYFGLGALAWIGYFVWQTTAAWSIYQATRLVGTALFCYAASTRHLTLRNP